MFGTAAGNKEEAVWLFEEYIGLLFMELVFIVHVFLSLLLLETNEQLLLFF